MSDVVIKQASTWNRAACCSKVNVWWQHCETNEALQGRGLSQNILNQEIITINKKAKEFNQHNNYHLYCCLIPLLIFVFFVCLIIIIINEKPWILCFLLPFVIFVTIWIIRGILSRHEKTWNSILSHIQQYIDNELNPRYRTSGISWRIQSRFYKYSTGAGSGRKEHCIRYNDIVLDTYLSSDNVDTADTKEIMICTVYTVDEYNKKFKRELLMAAAEKTVGEEPDADIGKADDTKIVDLNIHSGCMQDGYYKFGCFGSTNKYIEVSDDSISIGAVLQIYDIRDSNDYQIFYVKKIDGDYYTIQCKHSSLYWNVVGSSKENGKIIAQWDYHGLENQQFKFVNKGNGNFNIIARHSDKALSVENGVRHNGTKIIQYDVCDDADSHQLFCCTLVV